MGQAKKDTRYPINTLVASSRESHPIRGRNHYSCLLERATVVSNKLNELCDDGGTGLAIALTRS